MAQVEISLDDYARLYQLSRQLSPNASHARVHDQQSHGPLPAGEWHLVVQPPSEHSGRPERERRRFDCAGQRVRRQTDHCAFAEPIGRMTRWLLPGFYKRTASGESAAAHIDIYAACAWGHERSPYKCDPTCCTDGKEAKRRLAAPTGACRFMHVGTRCYEKPDVDRRLRAMFGANWMVPVRE